MFDMPTTKNSLDLAFGMPTTQHMYDMSKNLHVNNWRHTCPTSQQQVWEAN